MIIGIIENLTSTKHVRSTGKVFYKTSFTINKIVYKVVLYNKFINSRRSLENGQLIAFMHHYQTTTVILATLQFHLDFNKESADQFAKRNMDNFTVSKGHRKKGVILSNAVILKKNMDATKDKLILKQKLFDVLFDY